MPDDELAQSYLEVSRADLFYNAQTIVHYVNCPVIAVVKCDGYGASTAEAAAAWKACGVKMFGVSEPGEAAALREAGFTEEDILLLTPVANGNILDAMLEHNIILTVSGVKSAQFYAQNRKGRLLRAHVAVDTGMGRFGTRWTDMDVLQEIYRTEGISFEGIFSHFAVSFEKKYSLTKRQLNRFVAVTEALEAQGIPVGMKHIANSCAALRFSETRMDAVRIGSALVGRLPACVPVDLKRVGKFQAMVVDRRLLQKGDTTGYASICKVKRDMDVAVVALGRQSGFGLERHVENFRLYELLCAVYGVLRTYRKGLSVSCGGKALPVVGRVGTQYTLVDADGTDLSPGDYVSANVDMILPAPHRKYV